MKRLIVYPTLMAIAVFLASASAFMQGIPRPQLGNRGEPQQSTETLYTLPQTHFNQNSTHKLIIDKEDSADTAIYNELAARNAIRKEIDYGGYKLVFVDQNAVGGAES